MYEVTAHAVRVGKTIEVTISGFLPDSCHFASIKDVYPGGDIQYIDDPGYARVFIEEITRPASRFCTMSLVPWSGTTNILDSEHKEVEIFINNIEVLQIPIIEKGAIFLVIRLTGGIITNGSCSIIPEDIPFISIYSIAFGPASYSECAEWIKSNCKPSIDLLNTAFMAEGGGSGNPRLL